MDSRKLAHFVAVVDHGGFSAASRAVFVSQPALSLAVKDLEAELGVELFTRIGHRVTLNSARSALTEPARRVQRDLETGRAAVAEVAGVLAGSLSLASLPTLAADPMARMVGEFRRHYSGARNWYSSSLRNRHRVGVTCSRRSSSGRYHSWWRREARRHAG